MLSSGFTNAPLTRILTFTTIALSFAASLTDTKPFLPLAIRPHLLDYHQYWRLLTWQAAYLNSTEVLFAAMTFYQMRVIERLWGSRKFGVGSHSSNIIQCVICSTLDCLEQVRLTAQSPI